MQYYKKRLWTTSPYEPNTLCMFFMKKTTKENKTFLPRLHFFRNMVAEVGEVAKVVNISFEKSGPNVL